MSKRIFVKIPLKVLDDNQLTCIDIVVYAAIAKRVDYRGVGYMPLSFIAEDAHVTKRTVSRSIKRLIDSGHMEVKSGWTNGALKVCNTYYLLDNCHKYKHKNEGITRPVWVPKYPERIG